MHKFDADSRVSLFGMSYQYTSTHSQVASAFARTSFGADHHRTVTLLVFGHIENDYEDYLGTGQPLKTEDDLKAFVAQLNCFVRKATGSSARKGVPPTTRCSGRPQKTISCSTHWAYTGFSSSALGAVLMHDSRDNEDMPVKGWFLNVDNLA